MLDDVLKRIERRLKKLKLSAAKASTAAGLSEDAIRNMRRAVTGDQSGRTGVSTRTISALAPVLQTTAGWLMDGTGDEDAPGNLTRIIGIVGANPDGEVVMTTAHEIYDYAPIPPGGTADAVALEVRGHSMRGIADDGSLIYFEHQRTPPTEDMVGNVVIVETEDGRVLVKRLLRGSKSKHYDLESANGPTVSNIRIVWAAEITAIIPARQARRIILRSGEAA